MANEFLSRISVGKTTFLSCNSLPVSAPTGAGVEDLLNFKTPNNPIMMQFEITVDMSDFFDGDKIAIAVRENGIKVMQIVHTQLVRNQSIPIITFGKLIKSNTQFQITATTSGVGLSLPTVSAIGYGQVLNQETSLFG